MRKVIPTSASPDENVRKEAGYLVDGVPGFHSEENAKRLQYLNASNVLEAPEDGVYAEVDPKKQPKAATAA